MNPEQPTNLDQLTPPRPRTLPFSSWWPFIGGISAGLLLRFVFGVGAMGIYSAQSTPFTAMMASFIYLSPLLVGIVTVYIAERQRRRSWGYYFWAPFLANVLYVVGTLVIMIEGWICAILIIPLFAMIGMFGGVLMGIICRTTNWPKQTLYSVAILPFLAGSLETQVPLPDRIGTLERHIVIDAPPAEVWKSLMDADHIRPAEVDRAWMYRIGVPTPLAGITHETPDGLVREITMGKGIHFQQVSHDWQPQRYVHWQYRFAEDSIPARALDDHVKIGGRYFDLRNTTYTLTPHGDATGLSIRMQYRVSTQFNWYAEPIAELLIGNFEEVILDFYKRRSEA